MHTKTELSRKSASPYFRRASSAITVSISTFAGASTCVVSRTRHLGITIGAAQPPVPSEVTNHGEIARRVAGREARAICRCFEQRHAVFRVRINGQGERTECI